MSETVEWIDLEDGETFTKEIEVGFDSLLDRINPLIDPEVEEHRFVKYLQFALPMMAFYACECGEHTVSGPPPESARSDLEEAQEQVVEDGDYEPWMLDKAGVPPSRR